MPTPTPKLGIPKPLGNEVVSRAAFEQIWDTIDANAASQAELDQKFDAATGHKHTGQDGDAPPIPLAGIDPQARTSEGGTEPQRLAVTNTDGRVGAAEQAVNADTVDGVHVETGTSAGLRRITLSTAAPTSMDGQDGDVWLQYE